MISLGLKCQFLDSLTAAIHTEPSIDARLESRNSFITNGLVKVSGVRLGVSWQRKLRIGGGYSWLNSPVYNDRKIISSLGQAETVREYLKFGYLCYYIDFVFYKAKRWQLSVPIQVGTGLSHFQYTENNVLHKSRNYFLLLYEPGITVQFKVFKWAGVGADLAYRFTLKNNHYIAEKLSSPTFSFKLLVWFDEIFYTVAPKSKITQKYGPSRW
jgi:hypothetical protein